MRNDFSRELADLTYLQWTHARRSSGTAGTFLKAVDQAGEEKRYYKMSDYDSLKGVIGHECINEILADRLLKILGVEHVAYHPVHAKVKVEEKILETWVCYSVDFKRKGESKQALDDYFDLNRLEDESRMDFVIRNGWEGYVYQMLVVDFLILNRDRHGANMEVLKSAEGVRLAPLFDHGLSLLFSCHDDVAVGKFDAMADLNVQSFVGGKSLFENLTLIPKEKMPRFRRLEESDKGVIFDGLEGVLSEAHIEKAWEILWKRWNYYENLRNS